jgi:two-component system, LytTR family, response regulator
MYNCIIVDDSLIERDLMALHLSKIKNLNIVAECADGLEALDVIQNQEIDMVFSDIDMPDLSGIGLVKSLKTPPVFVFVTSYADYAVESYNLDVVDFIVKPATFERVHKAFQKAAEYIELKRKQNQELCIEPLKKESDSYFFVKDNHAHIRVAYDDVIHIESMGDFSKIYISNHKVYVVLVSLKNIIGQLPQDNFRRVHKQFIVNLKHVSAVLPTEISLSNSQSVPFSASYRAEFMESQVEQKTLKRFN